MTLTIRMTLCALAASLAQSTFAMSEQDTHDAPLPWENAQLDTTIGLEVMRDLVTELGPLLADAGSMLDALRLHDGERDVRAFLRREFAPDTASKHAAYSAVEVRESKQVLADGNVIARTQTRRLARDSQGRTFQETRTRDGATRITIHDPVTRQIIVLDPQARSACRVETGRSMAWSAWACGERLSPGPMLPPLPMMGVQPFLPDMDEWRSRVFSFADAQPSKQSHRNVEVIVRSASNRRTAEDVLRVVEDALDKQAPLFDAQARGEEIARTVREAVERELGAPATKGRRTTREALGTQMIDGVKAEGTRVTEIIPAGEIGNAKPIEIMGEQWYSAELGMVVQSRHSDPRTGESSYRLTQVSLAEPDAALFKVPEGYSLKPADRRR